MSAVGSKGLWLVVKLCVCHNEILFVSLLNNVESLGFVNHLFPHRFFDLLSEEGMQRQKNPSKWYESDLDASYERKPHHTYDSELCNFHAYLIATLKEQNILNSH